MNWLKETILYLHFLDVAFDMYPAVSNLIKMECLFVFHVQSQFITYFRYFTRGIELLEDMRTYFEGLASELQQVGVYITPCSFQIKWNFWHCFLVFIRLMMLIIDDYWSWHFLQFYRVGHRFIWVTKFLFRLVLSLRYFSLLSVSMFSLSFIVSNYYPVSKNCKRSIAEIKASSWLTPMEVTCVS